MRGRGHGISRLGRAAMVIALMGATLLATATPSGDPQQATQATIAAGAPAGAAGTSAAPATHSAGQPGVQPSLQPGLQPGVTGFRPDTPGFKVQLDEMGRPVVPSPSSGVAPAAVARMPRPPLIELETPAGGTMLMLDDRFHHHSVVHREADGTLSVHCGHAATPPAEAQHLSPAAFAPLAPPAACSPPTRQAAEALP